LQVLKGYRDHVYEGRYGSIDMFLRKQSVRLRE
jgi:hypothetical protein